MTVFAAAYRDGSDEPLTSACSGVLVAHRMFHCSDSDVVIYSSRVGDSVKDCPRGDDEDRPHKARSLLNSIKGKSYS